jgi:FkbM family methyltransferase
MTLLQWIWRLTSNVGLSVEFKRFFVAGLLKRRITQENIFGHEIRFFDYETFAILFEEIYVSEMYHFTSSSQVPVIIDCGSNIGMAIVYFKGLYPLCQVLAFEPDPVSFRVLEENVRLNGFENVALVNRALHHSKGSIQFYSDPRHPGSLVQSIWRENMKYADVRQVETALLSDYIDGAIDFLKMDIEGAEEGVMQSLVKNDKLRLVREMVIEYHHHLTAGNDRLGVFLSMLEEAGFAYQIKTWLTPPFQKGEFQSVLVYAYRG